MQLLTENKLICFRSHLYFRNATQRNLQQVYNVFLLVIDKIDEEDFGLGNHSNPAQLQTFPTLTASSSGRRHPYVAAGVFAMTSMT